MREKIPKLIISFETTTQVMALEAACKGDSGLGRVIPLPTQISANCGLAWCADICKREALEEKMAQNRIIPKDFHTIDFYQ